MGTPKENYEAVKNVIETTSKKWALGVYSFVDVKNNMIVVDTLKREVYRVDGLDMKPICQGRNKKNGYLYIPIETNIGPILYGMHTVVAMLIYGATAKYNIVNHKDNRPWNNSPSNLEWTGSRLNNIHGNILRSLNHYFPGVYTHYESNDSGVNHIILNTPLSVNTIADFLEVIEDDRYLSVDKDADYIDKSNLIGFVEWLGW